jgi:hypothetical protein
LHGIVPTLKSANSNNKHKFRKENEMEMAKYLSTLKSIEDFEMDYQSNDYASSSYWTLLPKLFCVTYNTKVFVYKKFAMELTEEYFDPKSVMKEWNINPNKKQKIQNEHTFQKEAVNLLQLTLNLNYFVLLKQV